MHPFNNPHAAPDTYAVNLRCLDGWKLEKLTVTIDGFEGQHWKEAVKSFRFADDSGTNRDRPRGLPFGIPRASALNSAALEPYIPRIFVPISCPVHCKPQARIDTRAVDDKHRNVRAMAPWKNNTTFERGGGITDYSRPREASVIHDPSRNSITKRTSS